MTSARAYSAVNATTPMSEVAIQRRDLTAQDVRIEILFCGICHSDLHQVRNDWGHTIYPVVPGHEIVGRVTEIGPGVSKHAVGDLVAVGCLVDSDRTCEECKSGLEQFCAKQVIVFGSPDAHLGGVTYGGFSESIVVDEHFVLRMPSNLDPAAAAPLLCAGITTYSPLRHWGVGPGKKVGIIGLGGLGHLGVKLASAFGAEVAVFTTSPKKTEDARRLGAQHVIVSSDAAAMRAHAGSFDFILDTVSGEHEIQPLLPLLRRDGNLTMVGAPAQPLAISAFGLIMGRKSVSGSNIGGIAETQEMLDFCADKNITADIEIIPVQQVESAFERMLRSDVKYRFVIDMASLKGGAAGG